MSYVINALDRVHNIRILACDSKDVVEEARRLHDLYPTSNAALGRTMSIAALIAMNIKEEDEKIQVRIDGDGPLKTLFVEARSNGELKGYCSDRDIYLKYNDSNKLAVGLAIGNGYLRVTRFSGYKEPFSSQVALQSGEIGDDFAYYFAASEQIPSLVSVGVLVDVDYSTKAAGAIIAELLPGHSEEDIVYLEEIQKTLRPISSELNDGRSIEDIVLHYFSGAEILEKREIRYHCDCSRERFLKGLLTLNKKDLDEVLEDEEIKIQCEFCNKVYTFDKDEIIKYQRENV